MQLRTRVSGKWTGPGHKDPDLCGGAFEGDFALRGVDSVGMSPDLLDTLSPTQRHALDLDSACEDLRSPTPTPRASA